MSGPIDAAAPQQVHRCLPRRLHGTDPGEHRRAGAPSTRPSAPRCAPRDRTRRARTRGRLGAWRAASSRTRARADRVDRRVGAPALRVLLDGLRDVHVVADPHGDRAGLLREREPGLLPVEQQHRPHAHRPQRLRGAEPDRPRARRRRPTRRARVEQPRAVVARRRDVAGEQRPFVVDVVRDRQQVRVGQRHAHALGLRAREPAAVLAEPQVPPPGAQRRRARPAVPAVAAAVAERQHDAVARRERPHGRADLANDPHALVAEDSPDIIGSLPWYACRSDPHTAVRVTSTTASPGSSTAGRAGRRRAPSRWRRRRRPSSAAPRAGRGTRSR